MAVDTTDWTVEDKMAEVDAALRVAHARRQAAQRIHAESVGYIEWLTERRATLEALAAAES